jgi:hypothetical protein
MRHEVFMANSRIIVNREAKDADGCSPEGNERTENQAGWKQVRHKNATRKQTVR